MNKLLVIFFIFQKHICYNIYFKINVFFKDFLKKFCLQPKWDNTFFL